jgi:hypothetical protein
MIGIRRRRAMAILSVRADTRPGIDLRPLIYERPVRVDLRELTRSRYSLEDIFVQVIRQEKEENA